jgi:prephenate dehydrogenase
MKKFHISIIGGSGKMGQWFARYLKDEGHTLTITGRNQEKLRKVGNELGVKTATNIEAVQQADIILISVPINSFKQVIQGIGQHVKPDQIIVDDTSIKTLPVNIMHQYISNGITLGAHPVFGPGAKDMRQNFVLTPTTNNEHKLANRIKGYLESKGGNVTLMSPKEHDEMMAMVLGLAHFIAIVTADSIIKLNNFTQLKAIGGTTYKVLLTLIESVVSEDAELYGSLQMSLPHLVNIQHNFIERARGWANLVKTGDEQTFVKQMNDLREKLQLMDPEFGKAYANMYRLVEGL